jgi:hypothetical protein
MLPFLSGAAKQQPEHGAHVVISSSLVIELVKSNMARTHCQLHAYAKRSGPRPD